MTGLGMVRMISHVGVRLTLRHGGGGQPTARWQDKSRNVRPGRLAVEGPWINDLAQCAASRHNVHIAKNPSNSISNEHCMFS
jgi:hypothetical protein